MNRSEAAPKRIRTHTVTHQLLDINWKLRVQRSFDSAIVTAAVDGAVAAAAAVIDAVRVLLIV